MAIGFVSSCFSPRGVEAQRPLPLKLKSLQLKSLQLKSPLLLQADGKFAL